MLAHPADKGRLRLISVSVSYSLLLLLAAEIWPVKHHHRRSGSGELRLFNLLWGKATPAKQPFYFES